MIDFMSKILIDIFLDSLYFGLYLVPIFLCEIRLIVVDFLLIDRVVTIVMFFDEMRMDL